MKRKEGQRTNKRKNGPIPFLGAKALSKRKGNREKLGEAGGRRKIKTKVTGARTVGKKPDN